MHVEHQKDMLDSQLRHHDGLKMFGTCKVVTSVHLPCLMTWLMLVIEECFEVKGAAMEASPSLTT